MSTLAAHHLLGTVDEGNLILLAGPDYPRVLQLVRASGIPYVEAHETGDPEVMRERARLRSESLVVIASIHEIEGPLNRWAFDSSRCLVNLAYAADRIVYAGLNGVAQAWPEKTDVRATVESGTLKVLQELASAGGGVSLTVNRL